MRVLWCWESGFPPQTFMVTKALWKWQQKQKVKLIFNSSSLSSFPVSLALILGSLALALSVLSGQTCDWVSFLFTPLLAPYILAVSMHVLTLWRLPEKSCCGRECVHMFSLGLFYAFAWQDFDNLLRFWKILIVQMKGNTSPCGIE